jgi:exoribonuclease-2
VVHQQIRAYLLGTDPLGAQQIAQRIGEAETGIAAVRRAERLSNQHWKLVWLRDHPEWRGCGVVVEKQEHKAVVLIPDLALEAKVRLRGNPELNGKVRLSAREIDLPELTCYFRVRDAK